MKVFSGTKKKTELPTATRVIKLREKNINKRINMNEMSMKITKV